jgi:hypothetical protein
MSSPDLTVRSDVLAIYFADGEGTLWRLDEHMYGSSPLPMSARDRALAKALLQLALVNVDRSAPPEARAA